MPASGTTISTSWPSAYLNHKTIKIEALIGTGKNQKRMDEVPVAQITQYAAEDADVALRLRRSWRRSSSEAELTKLFTTLELPLIDVLAELEFNGIRVDVERLAELSERVRRADGGAGSARSTSWPAASSTSARPSSCRRCCSSELKLPVLKKTKTGPSTDADVLEELAALHPLPAKIIEYRQFAKLKGTYVDALPADGPSARPAASTRRSIRTWPRPGGSARSDPNLQNIPIRTERAARSARRFCRAQPAGCCWRPTIRRSSCGCWPISPATRRCATRSRATKTFTPASPARSTACRCDR